MSRIAITKRWLRRGERELRHSPNASERTILALIRRIRRMERTERKLQLENWALGKILEAKKVKP